MTALRVITDVVDFKRGEQMIMMFLESMRQAFWMHSDKLTNFRICHRSYIISAA